MRISGRDQTRERRPIDKLLNPHSFGTRAVENIVGAINDVAVNMQQISLNAKQQAIAIEQVVDAMNSLNIAARESAAGIAKTKTTTQQLNQTAENLKSMI